MREACDGGSPVFEFDLSLRYQLSLFTQYSAELSRASIDRLPELVARKGKVDHGLALRLNKMVEVMPHFVSQDGQLYSSPSFTWTGPSLWKLAWSPTRVDLHVDSAGYADIAGRLLPLSWVIDRVAAQLAEGVSSLGATVTRFACAVTGEASDPGHAAVPLDARWLHRGKHDDSCISPSDESGDCSNPSASGE